MFKLQCILFIVLCCFMHLVQVLELNVQQNLTREARIMHLLKENHNNHNNNNNVNRRPLLKVKPKFMSRSDNLQLRQMHMQQMHRYAKRPPTMIRRVQQAPAMQHYAAYDAAKNTRYSAIKHNIKPNNLYRTQLFNEQQHPNALAPAFKASPHFNGQAIVRPIYELLTAAQQQQQQQDIYAANPPIQQYPLPTDAAAASTSARVVTPNSYLNQQEQFMPKQTQYYAAAANANAYYKPQQYAVYEEPETFSSSNNNVAAKATAATLQFSNAADAKEALEFIQFMGSDAYFLPKQEPDYRKLDDIRDRQQYQQQYKQHQQQQREHLKQQQLLQNEINYNNNKHNALESQLAATPIYAEHNLPRSANIVQGSYQTANNMFVVNSDGNKAVKHIVSSTPHTLQNAAKTTSYTQSIRRRTPEPVRFEFTEQDAMQYSFTHSSAAPRYGINSSTARIPTTLKSSADAVYHSRNNQDDPEDADDMQTDVSGRVALKTGSKSSIPPTEQKDTEDYCERICANVQDEDDEIICGSDGYMYTSESQMECYASCLHLDVTITGKGSCSAR